MNRLPRPKLVSLSWLHLPRRTTRLRLTLLSGALFLLSGATLVAVTYLLFDQTGSGQSMHGSPSGPSPSGSGSSQSSQSSTQAHQSIAQSAATVQRASDIHHLLVDFGIALGIVAVLAVLLGWFFAGRMLRPVRTITATARRISATNLHERLSLTGPNNELKELGESVPRLSLPLLPLTSSPQVLQMPVAELVVHLIAIRVLPIGGQGQLAGAAQRVLHPH